MESLFQGSRTVAQEPSDQVIKEYSVVLGPVGVQVGCWGVPGA